MHHTGSCRTQKCGDMTKTLLTVRNLFDRIKVLVDNLHGSFYEARHRIFGSVPFAI